MKEYGNYKTKDEAEYEKWKDYLIDKKGDYICSVPSCRKVWFPEVKDINVKRMTVYYKLCTECRMKSFLKCREYKAKKGNNYDKNRDG